MYGDVCVLIPTLNEAETIGSVIDGLREEGLENVLVVDGHSTDETREIAREHGADVFEQSGSGKGQAVREAVRHVDAAYVLMLDGDGTYRTEDAPKVLEPVVSGDADHVVGDRFANMESGAMTRLNRVGNSLINRAFARIHGHDYADILSGYRAFTRTSFEKMSLTADGFGIETEMAVECARHNQTVRVVDITYKPRPEDSETNLNPVTDGARIIYTLYRLAKTNNPLFYFGSVGGGALLLSVALGAYVAYEWFAKGVSHNVIAVAAGVALLFGVQLLMFGVLSDLFVTLHREQLHRIEQVRERSEE
ncbi:S-layer glycoprotein N-glycosyltransferase AglJ [Salarchaeum sp. JOR-1]|uniref:S-layer glycoprotein N-glycosyltransferase AglJ n=1 Tax=Salarchaeum sp. JOR-1 TaxID=2599399 RepID=UPI0011985187|nr:S-layer glycoprotein N-glycosyltransferase AglJ [Salarchaeum sp. JOR-1]QDX41015.1 S-layer glycoprotein N-glycosyltransferase AglJ [Salarchaeum sp. JOR-1]